MPLINRCGGGSSFAAVIQVTYNSGAVCTCTNGSTTLTAPDTSGECTFKVTRKGTWTVTVVFGEYTETENVSITNDGELRRLSVFAAYVYGISRNITNSSPVWARTDHAVGFTATASVGTVAGASDFDNCYPWNGIERITLPTPYKDVMVKIPKFWYRRYREGDVEYIKIATKEISGFTLHPAFNHANAQKDCIYVGAYNTAGGEGDTRSNSGVNGIYLTSTSKKNMRTYAQAKGAGWGLIDISTLSAIQMLILVEFATNNVQEAIGYGVFGKSDTANINGTGKCDDVPNLTGTTVTVSSNNISANANVIWRGIENLWGNVSEFIDGLDYSAGNYYVCNDPSLYDTSTAASFTQLSYSAAYQYWRGEYIKTVGFDPNNSHVMLPTTAGGSSSTYYCDSVNTSTSSAVYTYGGSATSSRGYAGLFCSEFYMPANAQYGDTGSRLIYIPQEAAS